MKAKLIDVFIPLLSAAGSFLPFYVLENFWVGLAVGLFAAVVVLYIVRKMREITVPEALATGYFVSFLDPIVNRTSLEAVIEDHGNKMSYPGDKVSFKIIVPEELDSLGRAFDELKDNYRSVSLIHEAKGKSFGVYVDESENGLVVADVPNTLGALSEYLKRQYKDLNKRKGWISNKSVSQEGVEEFKRELKKLINDKKYQSDALRKKVEIIEVGRSKAAEHAAV